MMDATANLALPYILPSQAQKHVPHNEALRRLDALVQLSCLDRTLTDPPASPSQGDRHIVGTGATGDWTGKDGQIAAWQDGAWAFFVPAAGWLAWVQAEELLLAHDGSGWAETTPQSLDLLGINTAADETNRLTVSSGAVLLNHDGTDQQTKINKASSTDTASLVFQSGFSGRAEFGLTGDDDFHVKVSADGSTWNEAIVIDRTSGEVSMPQSVWADGPDGDDGSIQMNGSGAFAATGLTWDDTNKRLGHETSSPDASIHVRKQIVDRSSAAFKFDGYGLSGPTSNEGVGLFLTWNDTANHQFAILETENNTGVRFLGAAIDGYNAGSRAKLKIGTNTEGAYIGTNIADTQFAVSNSGGTISKTVAEIGGASGQTGDLLRVTKVAGTSSGDALSIAADGKAVIGGDLEVDGSAIDFTNLPTSDPASAGRLWNDSGTVRVSAG